MDPTLLDKINIIDSKLPSGAKKCIALRPVKLLVQSISPSPFQIHPFNSRFDAFCNKFRNAVNMIRVSVKNLTQSQMTFVLQQTFDEPNASPRTALPVGSQSRQAGHLRYQSFQPIQTSDKNSF